MVFTFPVPCRFDTVFARRRWHAFFLSELVMQQRCGFLVAAFLAGQIGFSGDQFAAEGLGEDGLRQSLDAPRSRSHFSTRRSSAKRTIL